MRNMRKYIIASIISLTLSVAAYAVPINVEAYAVTVPNTITLSQDDNSAMTANDFIAAAPYVVDLAVATPVPIKQTAEVVQLNLGLIAKTAIRQNANFERWLN